MDLATGTGLGVCDGVIYIPSVLQGHTVMCCPNIAPPLELPLGYLQDCLLPSNTLWWQYPVLDVKVSFTPNCKAAHQSTRPPQTLYMGNAAQSPGVKVKVGKVPQASINLGFITQHITLYKVCCHGNSITCLGFGKIRYR